MRKRNHIPRISHNIGLVILIGWMCQACIKDDMSHCGLNIRFRYTYNITEADAFSQEADWVRLWVYDDRNRLVSQYQAEGIRGTEDFILRIPYFPEGSYSFVAWAGSSDKTGEHSNFKIPDVAAGSPKEELTARLPRHEDGISRTPFNALLNAAQEVEVTGVLQDLDIDMMKCTHTMRVILMPIDGAQTIEPAAYEFSIKDCNGWLAYNAEPYREDPVTYMPYYQEAISDATNSKSETVTVSSAIVAELNTSRLIAKDKPRLIVRDAANGKVVMDIDLAWLLSLQAIGEHQAEWSNQEYLDRQDEFALTFFVDTDKGTWMQTHIIVNGWVLSLENIEL